MVLPPFPGCTPACFFLAPYPPCLYTHTPAVRPRTHPNLAATGVLLSSPGGNKTQISTKTYSAGFLSASQPSSKAAATAAASDENNGPPRLEKVCLPAVIRAVIHPVIPHVIRAVIHPVIPLVIHPVIPPVIHPVIPTVIPPLTSCFDFVL